MEIVYTTQSNEVSENDLGGFFVGWPKAPSSKTLRELLNESDYKILAKDGEKVVGFITAISDGVLSAYIPFLEVLPEYQGQGIGKELASQMLQLLSSYYMIDLLCDEEMQAFYESLGMQKALGMMVRNYKKLSDK